jgi:ADP-heptose:LPS heptosyltransferase
LENISSDELALELLNQCLRGNSHSSELLEALLRMAQHPDAGQARKASRALFSTVVERLGDLFEPCLCDSYASLFSEALAYVLPELDATDLLARYRRIRQPRTFEGREPREVFVLSRVTLGADVAVTSAVLDAAKRRFPEARVRFVGPQKNWELFARDARLSHVPVPYRREGTLRERLEVWPGLRDAMASKDAIVIDPDSRLTQLGLLPVCEEERYYFFESRSYGWYGDETLTALTRQWLSETFDIDGATQFIAPAESASNAMITVSLGVGENLSKRVADPFEEELLAMLARTGESMLVDQGAAEEEAARVRRALARTPDGQARTWHGAFAPFAASIAMSRLYVGYDSAGQHVAAACGTPMVTVFAGYASPRMFERWKPEGPGRIEVVRATNQDPAVVLEAVRGAIARLVGQAFSLSSTG